MANQISKDNSGCPLCLGLNNDGLGQLIVDVVAPVLDGHGQISALTGDHGDGFTGVATQRKEKGVEFLVVSLDGLNDVLLPHFCIC